MADEIDRAQHYDEMYRDQALAIHFNKLRASAGLPPMELGAKTGECIDCGEPIEPKRIQAKPDAVRCVACQAKHERLNGRWA